MSVYRSGDPDADFRRREAEQQAWEDSLPKCQRCGDPMDDYVFDLGSGEILCQDCVVAKYRKKAEGYLQ